MGEPAIAEQQTVNMAWACIELLSNQKVGDDGMVSMSEAALLHCCRQIDGCLSALLQQLEG